MCKNEKIVYVGLVPNEDGFIEPVVVSRNKYTANRVVADISDSVLNAVVGIKLQQIGKDWYMPYEFVPVSNPNNDDLALEEQDKQRSDLIARLIKAGFTQSDIEILTHN